MTVRITMALLFGHLRTRTMTSLMPSLVDIGSRFKNSLSTITLLSRRIRCNDHDSG